MGAKEPPRKKSVSQPAVAPLKQSLLYRLRTSIDGYLARRPHRSFRRTRRRDYARSLRLPGYIAFTYSVQKTLWAQRKVFIWLVIVYALLSAIVVGVGSQSAYNTLTSTLKSTSGNLFSGNWGAIGQASLLFASTITGSLSQNLTQTQQIYAGLLGLLAWLTTVWLLRNILAGHKVRLRDGLYSSGSPIIATFLVALLLIVQLLPLALALIGYSAASSTGLLDNGVEAMVFWFAAGLLAVLTLYWMTSTIIALVVVTLPGIYPYQAIKTAGDLVVGRRLRILMRWLWMALCVVVFWTVVMIPIILIDGWFKVIVPASQAVPTVPIALLIMSSLTLVWVSAYVYLLYRKVVADDARPA